MQVKITRDRIENLSVVSNPNTRKGPHKIFFYKKKSNDLNSMNLLFKTILFKCDISNFKSLIQNICENLLKIKVLFLFYALVVQQKNGCAQVRHGTVWRYFGISSINHFNFILLINYIIGTPITFHYIFCRIFPI